MNELWKPTEVFEDKYEVSSKGRIRNKKTGRILIPFLSRGYYKVYLCNDGERKMCPIHRSVARAFIPQTELTMPIVNHINGIKTDNRVENLEWCTLRENSSHQYLLQVNTPTIIVKFLDEYIKCSQESLTKSMTLEECIQHLKSAAMKSTFKFIRG